jgi:hypothetical protein
MKQHGGVLRRAHEAESSTEVLGSSRTEPVIDEERTKSGD